MAPQNKCFVRISPYSLECKQIFFAGLNDNTFKGTMVLQSLWFVDSPGVLHNKWPQLTNLLFSFICLQFTSTIYIPAFLLLFSSQYLFLVLVHCHNLYFSILILFSSQYLSSFLPPLMLLVLHRYWRLKYFLLYCFFNITYAQGQILVRLLVSLSS